MGNSISKKYQNFYLENMFQTIQNTRDKLIGNYKIIKFPNEKDIFMVTTLDPALYHHYTDVELFKKKFSKTSSYLSTFLFVEMNKEKNDQFDFIFEFGKFFSTPMSSEKNIIKVLNNFLESLIDLEEKNLHYPKLDKNYIIINKFGELKLLNPLCFYEFLEDLTNVYINPNITNDQKNEFSQKKLLNNKNEFFEFVLSLFSRINFDLVKRSEMFKRNFFVDLEKKFSNNFLGFLKLLSEKKFSSFREIKKILNGKKIYKENFNFETKNYLSESKNYSSDSKNYSSESGKRFSIDTRTNRKSHNQNRFSLARQPRNKKNENHNNRSYKDENPYLRNFVNENNFNPFKKTPEKKKEYKKPKFDFTNNLETRSPKKNERNIFKKEINTPTALNYNKKKFHHKKNIQSFTGFTSDNKNLFKGIELNKIDSLKNLTPIQEGEENNFHRETAKKLFQKKNIRRKSSVEKTLKKSKSKNFFKNLDKNLKKPAPTNFKMVLNDKEILFEHYIKNIFNYFNSINGIVNHNDSQKPSMYHNVEKFPLSKKKKKFTNINKYYVKKSLQNLDKLKSLKNLDKFNTKENYNFGIIKKKNGRRLSENKVIKRYNSSNDLKRSSVSRKLFGDRINIMDFRGGRF